MNGLTPIEQRPESLTEQVFTKIQDSIVDGTLAPGSRVSEASVAELLGVSKTPVRESLVRLRVIGLVESTGTGRFRIVAPSAQAVQDAYEVRSLLETEAARMAAGRISSTDARRLADFAQDTTIMAGAGTLNGFRDTDRRFHLAVAAATDNAVLSSRVEQAYVLSAALTGRSALAAPVMSRCAEDHVQIAQMIGDMDGEGAATAMATHLGALLETALGEVAEDPAEKQERISR